MMQYRVCVASSAGDLVVQVQEMIDYGWEPQGGVACSYYETTDQPYGKERETEELCYFAQAMTKR